MKKTTAKAKFTSIKNKLKKARKGVQEIKSENLSEFCGLKAKIAKSYVDWILSNGEACGIPFEEINFIKTRPTGVIQSVRFDGFYDGFVFHLNFDSPTITLRLGIEDISIVE